jgi:hypothetical protein
MVEKTHSPEETLKPGDVTIARVRLADLTSRQIFEIANLQIGQACFPSSGMVAQRKAGDRYVLESLSTEKAPKRGEFTCTDLIQELQRRRVAREAGKNA